MLCLGILIGLLIAICVLPFFDILVEYVKLKLQIKVHDAFKDESIAHNVIGFRIDDQEEYDDEEEYED